MSQILLSNMSFTYDGGVEPVFSDVNLSLDTEWRLGLVGRNGRGKTTLLRILTGELTPTGTVRADIRVKLFPYAADETLSAADVAATLCPQAQGWEVSREARRIGLAEGTEYRPLGTLSGGERTKALLAILFLQPDTFVLLDEPTNHLDSDGRAAAAKYLSAKRGYIVASHDQRFLDACTDKILHISKTGVELENGNYTAFLENRARREAFERTQSERLKADISRLNEAAAHAARAAAGIEGSKRNIDYGSGEAWDKGFIGHKAAKKASLAKNMQARAERAAEEKRGLLKDVEEVAGITLTPLLHHDNVLLIARGTLMRGGEALSAVNLELRRGERMRLTGPNGCGKTTLLSVLTGAQPADAAFDGRLYRASNLKISYVAQTPPPYAGTPMQFASDTGADTMLFCRLCVQTGIAREALYRSMRGFSEGQRKKVSLARSLSERAHLYIWDEPLNYVDNQTRRQLEALLEGTTATLLFVDHDEAFAEKIMTASLRLGAPAR